MRRVLFLMILLCLVVTAPVLLAQDAGQSAKTGQAREATLDSSITSRVDKLFEKWDKPGSPGCALGIVKDGQLIYKRGYGMANLDYNVAISPQSVFDIQSMDKQFTAMSILLLAKRGKLSLDDEIQKYLPEVPRYQSPITIRHLIHHTSGIRNVSQLAALAAETWGENVHLTDDDWLVWIARQKELDSKPGEVAGYSNSGYFLLGLIVKRVSGKSQREFAEENIFKPLGMNNTHFDVDRTSVVKNRATGYFVSSNAGLSAAITNRDELDSSVEDLFLWDQNFYDNKLGGGPDLINEEVSPGILNNGEKTEYAFGLHLDEYKGLKRIRHGGEGGGFMSEMIRFPEQKFSVMRLCNGYNIPWGQSEQVADIFLAAQFKKAPDAVKETPAAPPDVISVPEKELASLTGLYVDAIRFGSIRFYMKDGKLMITAGPGYVYVLSPLGQNRFINRERSKEVGARIEQVFEQPIPGEPMQVKLLRGGKAIGTLARVQDVSSTIQLAEFAGKYVSDELGGATYTLSIKDGKLVLEAMGRKDILLIHAFADTFLVYGLIQWYPGELNQTLAIVKFTRNQQNAISGFTISRNEGPRNLRFDRVKQ
jgi:CubicO group peptidase (beta-lactamase class C family)